MSPLEAVAQSVNAAAGTSSFLDASGFQLDYKWAPVTGWMGMGVTQGAEHVGAFLGTKYRGFDLGVGDRFLPFVLDTDVFDQSYIYYGRGVSFGRRSDNQQWTFFAGTSAFPFTTPFLRAYERGGATGAFFYQCHFGSQMVLRSYNIISDQVTSLVSLGITLDPHWKVAWSGGVGGNSPYSAVATDFHYGWVKLTGSYAENGHNFRRFRIPNLPYPERTGGNARVLLTPRPNLGLQVGHETVLSPIFGTQDSLRATLDSVGLFTSIDGYAFNASASRSRGGRFLTRTEMLTVNRRLDDRLSVFGAAIRIHTQTGKPSNLLLATADEKLTRRLSVRENFTHGPGTKTMGWGFRFLSNPVSLGIDYQTVFSPLAGGFNGRPFLQAWVVNAQVQLPRGVGLHYDTFVDPFGKFRYTAFLSGIRYSAEAGTLEGSTPSRATMGRYVIRGIVEDEGGKPVWGVAVQIDSTFVYSDSSGQFYIRLSHKGEYPLSIAHNKSLNSSGWEIVTAPPTVLAETDEKAKTQIIVVRRASKSSNVAP